MSKKPAANGGGKAGQATHSFAVLQKKIEKVDSMLEDIASQRGGVKSKEYKKLYRKREEYQWQIEQTEEFKELQAELMASGESSDDSGADDDENDVWEDKLKSPAAMKNSVAAARASHNDEYDEDEDAAYESRNLDNSPAPLGMKGVGKKRAIPNTATSAASPPYKNDRDYEDENQSYDEETVDSNEGDDRSYDEVTVDSDEYDGPLDQEGGDDNQSTDDEDEEDVEVQRIQQAIEILYDKVDKVDHLLQEIVQERGEGARDDDDFVQLSAKREEYVAALEEAEEWLEDYYNGGGDEDDDDGDEVDEEGEMDLEGDREEATEEEDDMDMFDAADVARQQLEDEAGEMLADEDEQAEAEASDDHNAMQ